MNAKFILADSGGTATKWAVVSAENEVISYETASLHPRNILDVKTLTSELKELFGSFLHAPLFFYGAGCSSNEGKEKVSELLINSGFENFQVETDILGVCRGLCGQEPGFVAILGTGSILVYYDGKSITQRFGGLGPIIGDEGSGFYFGKLLVREALECEHWTKTYENLFGSKAELQSWLTTSDLIARVAKLSSKLNSDEFDILHRTNFQLFMDRHFKSVPKSEIMHVSGSYGFFHESIISEVLTSNGYHLGSCVQNPLEQLIKYHRTQ